LGVGQKLTNSLPKKTAYYKMLHRASGLERFFGTILAMKMDMRFGT
jgi:hypothetical protein